jgi:imidazolonepropionase
MNSQTHLWTNARIATCDPSMPGLGIIEDGAIAARNGRIAWVGRASDLPAEFAGVPREDLGRRWVLPGLIDCHTHIVHGGNRALEFEMRLAGESYEAIARAGGGIVSTVKATRAASEDELVAQSLPRLDALIAEGVTTIEVKSGYGLDLASEAKMLRAARQLEQARDVSVATTFLGLHALSPEFRENRLGFVDLVVNEMLPALVENGLVDAVDAFCEGIAFTPDETARLFEAAGKLGKPVKLHADQLSDLDGAALAARFGALSADHLEYTSEAGALAMAEAGTVAVILPGAYYMLRETHQPPIAAFRAAGTRMAIATDCNPGTSPVTSLLLSMNMAATLFRMTVEECLLGVTRHAAAALGRDDIGVIAAGKAADLSIWNVDLPAELVYRLGFNPLFKRIRGGRA